MIRREKEKDKEKEIRQFEEEFKAIASKAVNLGVPLTKFTEEINLINQNIKQSTQKAKEETSWINKEITEKQLVSPNLVGRILMNMFLESPISKENKSLMEGSVFRQTKELSNEVKDRMEAQNKMLNTENDIYDAQIAMKRKKLKELRQSIGNMNKMREFWLKFACSVSYKLDRSIKSGFARVLFTDPISSSELEATLLRDPSVLKLKYINIDLESLSVFEAVNSSTPTHRVKLKSCKDLSYSQHLFYIKLTYNNLESQDYCLIIVFSCSQVYESWLSNIESICKSVIMNRTALTKSDTSITLHPHLSSLPFEPVVDYGGLELGAGGETLVFEGEEAKYQFLMMVSRYSKGVETVLSRLK